jgi:hypothetical protein
MLSLRSGGPPTPDPSPPLAPLAGGGDPRGRVWRLSPGCAAAWSGAERCGADPGAIMRIRRGLRSSTDAKVALDPGSAAHHFVLRAPGERVELGDFVCSTPTPPAFAPLRRPPLPARGRESAQAARPQLRVLVRSGRARSRPAAAGRSSLRSRPAGRGQAARRHPEGRVG